MEEPAVQHNGSSGSGGGSNYDDKQTEQTEEIQDFSLVIEHDHLTFQEKDQIKYGQDKNKLKDRRIRKINDQAHPILHKSIKSLKA